MPQVEVNSTTLHYEVVGSGNPLLLIHGLGSSTRDWERQATAFSGTHRVITVDLRGHGGSAKPEGRYTIALFAQDVIGLIQQLDVAPLAIVGISLGGMVGFQIASDQPELIDKLVVVNALPDNDLLAKARAQIVIRKLIVRLLGMRKMGEVLAGRLFPDESMVEERALMASRWAENDKSAYQRSFQAIVDWPGVTGDLDRFNRPLLMISSDQDYVPLDKKQPYLEKLPAMEHVVISDAHHGVPMERPAAFNEVLKRFLSASTA